MDNKTFRQVVQVHVSLVIWERKEVDNKTHKVFVVVVFTHSCSE